MADWNSIVRQHGRVAWLTAYRLLGNEADALDCYQNTFLEALKVARREAVHDWPPLLRRLATVRALDMLRTRYRDNSRNEPGQDVLSAAAVDLGPGQQAEAAELAERLRVALARLPPQQAEVFCLRWFDEMSYRQIAERLELDTNTVGVLLHRARKHLQGLLASARPEPRKLDRDV